jgi:adenylate kinase family enzyme
MTTNTLTIQKFDIDNKIRLQSNISPICILGGNNIDKLVLMNNLKNIHSCYNVMIQELNSFTKQNFDNYDYVFIFKNDNSSYCKEIYDLYSNIFHDYNTFYEIYDSITKNNKVAMVVCNNVKSENITDKIFWYKMSDYIIEHFDINKMKKDSSSIIIGQRGTGKSILANNLKEQNNNIKIFDNIDNHFLRNKSYIYSPEIITMQYPIHTIKNYIEKYDYIFLFQNIDIELTQERLYKICGNIFPDYETFYKIYKSIINNNYTSLVICNNIESDNFLDKIFYYKADYES